MRTLLAAMFGLLLLGGGVAMADSVTGTVESVDPNSKTVVINGQPYIVEDQAAGIKFDELKVGEKVMIEYDVNTNDVSEITLAK